MLTHGILAPQSLHARAENNNDVLRHLYALVRVMANGGVTGDPVVSTDVSHGAEIEGLFGDLEPGNECHG